MNPTTHPFRIIGGIALALLASASLLKGEIYTVINTADSGDGSLRLAIEQANVNHGSDTIEFAIPEGDSGYDASLGVWVIQLADPNNESTGHGVMINGAMETLAGTNGDGVGDELERNIITASDDSDVMIRNQQWDEADRGGDGNLIVGNYIGTDVTGTVALPRSDKPPCHGVMMMMGTKYNRIEGNLISGHTGANPSCGVVIDSPGTDENVVRDNLIGVNAPGTAALVNAFEGVVLGGGARNNLIEANVISGNGAEGVEINGNPVEDGFSSGNHRILSNLIGTDVTGADLLPNDGIGLYIWNSANNLARGNVISANNLAGVEIGGPDASHNHLAGNLIGTDITGKEPLGNGQVTNPWGVGFFEGAHDNFVGTNGDGQEDAGEGNVIAFQSAFGVVVYGAETMANSIRGNSIHSNAGLGIDLNGDGPTPNDTGDTDDGPNGLQNFPVISSATRTSTKTVVEGSLHSAANGSFIIDFYANLECDGLGYGEGEMYLGWAYVSTGENGSGTFTERLPVPAPAGWFITATATDANGNTSEFSACSPPVVAGSIEVAIDIKPGSDPNSINLGSNGTVPVAILSATDFDAATVDPTTVTLANAAVKLRGKGTPMAAMEDVNGDGRPDLVVHVLTSALELAHGDVEARLTGSTVDGTPIEGTDSVRIVKE